MTNILLPVGIVGIVGALSGLLLSVAARYMAVPVDERVSKARKLLPGANCGACGFAGCDEYAEKLVGEGVKTNLCTPGGADVAKGLSELLGASFENVVAKKAVVRCSGTTADTEYIMDYQGPKTCQACNFNYQGRGSCPYSCLGFGDCAIACPAGAISMRDGIAKVDKALCSGCGVCASACPKSLIKIIRADSDIYVACSSADKGAFTRKVCKAGCIGCKKCEKACRYSAITVTGNLASIDPEKCSNCGECVAVCPTGVIRTDKCELMTGNRT